MLLEQVEPEHRLFLLLIAVTGLRLSEALGFRWQDFEASAGTLSITHRLWRARLGRPKTKKSRAKIQLAQELVEALADHQEASGFNSPEDFIFCRPDGAPLDPDHLRRGCSIQQWAERASSAVTAHMASTYFAIQPRAYCTSELMI